MINLYSLRLGKFFSAMVLIVALIYAYQNGLKKAHAVVNPSGLTGKYGCMMNRNINGFETLYLNNSASDAVGILSTAILNYDDNSVKTLTGMVSDYKGNSPRITDIINTGTFVETVISGYPDVYRSVVTLSDPNNNTSSLVLIIVPVNSGKTVLMTEINAGTTGRAPWTGVCQKI